MNIEYIAKLAHEINRAYCESIGDSSQVSWDDVPEWQRQSSISGVKFRIENPDSPNSSQHEKWFDDKVKDALFVAVVKMCVAVDSDNCN